MREEWAEREGGTRADKNSSSTNKTGTQWNVAFDYVKYVQDGLCLDAGSDSGYSLSFKPSVLPALWFVDPHTLPVRIPSPLSLSRPDPSSVPSTLRLPLPSVPSALRRPFLRPFSSSFPSSSNHRLPKHVQGTLTEDPVAGTKVHLWTCHGQAQQQWVVANGQVKLAGKNLCLDVTDGDPSKQVQVWDCVPGSKNQKFDAAPVSLLLIGRS